MISTIESLTDWKLSAQSLHIYLISTVRKLADEPPPQTWVGVRMTTHGTESRAREASEWDPIKHWAGESWRGIHYAASWSVSKTIYRPLTRGKHWLSRHPHRVTCRRQTKYFSSPLALPRNIFAAACPELGIRYLHPDIVHSHPHQFSRNENSLSWFLRKQQAFKVAGASGIAAEIVKWSRWIDKNVSLPGCDEYFINLIWELIIHFETTPFSAKSPNKTSTRQVIQLRCSKLLCAGVWRNIFLVDMTAATF